MKRILLLFSALMLSSITLWANHVEIDGIYYYINEGDKTAKVAQYHWSEPYSGSITIPDYIYYNSNNYSVTSIGNEAFRDCSGLTEITIPNSVTSIGDYAFYGCSGLTEIIIGNSVTLLGKGAFKKCSKLTAITIGKNVTSIGESAFYGCYKLTKIIAYPTTVPTVDIEYITFSNYNGYLYVPCEVYEEYDLDAEFGKFKYIKCIEDDIPSAVIENLAEANITIYNGLITVSDTSFSIYNLAGQNVTALNGFLQPGVYLVSVNDNIAKVMVK